MSLFTGLSTSTSIPQLNATTLNAGGASEYTFGPEVVVSNAGSTDSVTGQTTTVNSDGKQRQFYVFGADVDTTSHPAFQYLVVNDSGRAKVEYAPNTMSTQLMTKSGKVTSLSYIKENAATSYIQLRIGKIAYLVQTLGEHVQGSRIVRLSGTHGVLHFDNTLQFQPGDEVVVAVLDAGHLNTYYPSEPSVGVTNPGHLKINVHTEEEVQSVADVSETFLRFHPTPPPSVVETNSTTSLSFSGIIDNPDHLLSLSHRIGLQYRGDGEADLFQVAIVPKDGYLSSFTFVKQYENDVCDLFVLKNETTLYRLTFEGKYGHIHMDDNVQLSRGDRLMLMHIPSWFGLVNDPNQAVCGRVQINLFITDQTESGDDITGNLGHQTHTLADLDFVGDGTPHSSFSSWQGEWQLGSGLQLHFNTIISSLIPTQKYYSRPSQNEYIFWNGSSWSLCNADYPNDVQAVNVLSLPLFGTNKHKIQFVQPDGEYRYRDDRGGLHNFSSGPYRYQESYMDGTTKTSDHHT